MQRLKEAALTDAVKFYKSRTPKKPTDITTKLQLKKMVDDLESEIGEIFKLDEYFIELLKIINLGNTFCS